MSPTSPSLLNMTKLLNKHAFKEFKNIYFFVLTKTTTATVTKATNKK